MTAATQTTREDLLERVAGFHGHMCPGAAMGIRAAEVALREIGPHAADEEVVAIVETDMCAVDAIQLLTGCTYGKGNLIHRDYGKNAYTFMRRSDGKAIRIATRPDAWGPPDAEREALMARTRGDEASAADRQRLTELQIQRSRWVMDVPEEQLFEVHQVEAKPPQHARIHTSLPCEECREPTMETRTRRFRGRTLCIPCFQRFDSRD